MKTETYKLVAKNGRPVRMATAVVFEDGYRVSFMEKLPAREAIPQAKEVRRRQEELYAINLD